MKENIPECILLNYRLVKKVLEKGREKELQLPSFWRYIYLAGDPTVLVDDKEAYWKLPIMSPE